MGSSMCGHLIDAGYQATVYNRTQTKTDAARREGGQGRVVRRARWPRRRTWSSRSSAIPGDVREVILGEQGALVAAPGPARCSST